MVNAFFVVLTNYLPFGEISFSLETYLYTMKWNFLLLIFTFLYVNLNAQEPFPEDLEFHYSFDQCVFEDVTGQYASSTSKDCTCGLIDQAVSFDGGNGSILLPSEASQGFNNDFTLSFYFQVRNESNPVTLLSLTKDNRIDSSLYVRYIPSVNRILVQMAASTSSFITLEGAYDPEICWNHFTFTKQDNEYYLYMNGVFSDSEIAIRSLSLFPNTPLEFGSEDFLTFGEEVWIGRMDEVKLYNRFLGASEIDRLSLNPDQILTQDTTIFLGAEVPIRTGPTCALTPLWSPTTDLDDPSDFEPVASPEESIIYYLDFNDNGCNARDSLCINVIDENDLDCNDILLPKAFTPNGDDLNELYGISNTFIIESLSFFEVYDKNGQKLYSTTDKNAEWDGSYKGTKVNPGMYIYKVSYQCKGDQYDNSGTFNVLR